MTMDPLSTVAVDHVIDISGPGMAVLFLITFAAGFVASMLVFRVLTVHIETDE